MVTIFNASLINELVRSIANACKVDPHLAKVLKSVMASLFVALCINRHQVNEIGYSCEQLEGLARNWNAWWNYVGNLCLRRSAVVN